MTETTIFEATTINFADELAKLYGFSKERAERMARVLRADPELYESAQGLIAARVESSTSVAHARRVFQQFYYSLWPAPPSTSSK
jgi:hypothetical protein